VALELAIVGLAPGVGLYRSKITNIFFEKQSSLPFQGVYMKKKKKFLSYSSGQENF
jgi:hypothetical protein